MIIVQVFGRTKIFFVQRGSARVGTWSWRGFRTASPHAAQSSVLQVGALAAAISATRHRASRGRLQKPEKIAAPHLGRTRIQCL
jgi:hypothetical protein